jgi:hypothetical protein
MLYESTKNLLQSILSSLEGGDGNRWDDQTESGNACLYEMHQMSKPLYKAYRSDSINANLPGQSSLPEKLNRAMPHVRTMVIAIRHKDQSTALESGKVALAEMNRAGTSLPLACGTGPRTERGEPVIIVAQQPSPTGKHGRVVESRRSSKTGKRVSQ